MSLIVPLAQNKDLVVRPAIVKNFSEVVIEKIVDEPATKTVSVFVTEFGLIKVDALSDANYDKPQWTNESLVQAVREQFALS